MRHDDGNDEAAILRDFIEPVQKAGWSVHLKNLYNLYVYFWRWALWKVFEAESAQGSGIVCFISASSFLAGPAFAGMRAHMRALCDEIFVLDLGGEGRGARQSENVFNIQTPVCITLALRRKKKAPDAPPAVVRYARVEGSRREKLERLARLKGLADIAWRECPEEPLAPFRPAGEGDYWRMPRITQLFPVQYSGVECKRTWPIGPTEEVLARRWQELVTAPPEKRAELFKETRDRKVSRRYRSLTGEILSAITDLDADTPIPEVVRYGYRSLDRQWLIADPRLADYLRPELWQGYKDKQLYFCTLLGSGEVGDGPALMASAWIPDRHFYRGSYGGKGVIPLYVQAGTEYLPNISARLLETLSTVLNISIFPKDFAAYVYGVLACPAFTDRFAEELAERELRVPITKDAAMFREAAELGRRLVFLHTYGERFGKPGESLPQGRARCVAPVPGDAARYPEEFHYDEATQTLHVGEGKFAPVARDVWEYEISGFRPVASWLGYRMKNRRGRKSSPLDDIGPETWPARFTTELLELLGVIEHSLEVHEQQAQVLERILGGRLFSENELPLATGTTRRTPRRREDRRTGTLNLQPKTD